VPRRWMANRCAGLGLELGEGPCWDARTKTLLWVDILAGDLYVGQPSGSDVVNSRRIGTDRPLGAVAPCANNDGGWLAACGAGFAHIAADGTVRELAQPEAGAGTRMNDGACDPEGRFWAGSMAYDNTPGAGSLYRFNDGTCERVLDNLTIPNGLGWSPDGTSMYVTDSGGGCIDAYSFDLATGNLDHVRTVIQIPEAEGVPDGLAVDAEGFLWAAIWGGGEVRRYAPDGGLVGIVVVPASQPTSCCFGGSGSRVLYITSATFGMSSDALAGEPWAGDLFCCDVGIEGRAVSPYRGALVWP
jgi:sugar lactone lactonase YvrE